MSSERVFYQPASKRRRTTSRILSLLIILAEIAASVLPIVDAGFPAPKEKPMPYVACVGLIVVFIVGNSFYVAKRGALPGLTSLGVVAVRMRDGGNAGILAVQKYAVEGAATVLTLVVGLPFILHFTNDRFGRTWFDRVGGVIYVDTRRPMEDDEEFDLPGAVSSEAARSAGSPLAPQWGQVVPSQDSAAEPPVPMGGQSAYSAPEAAYVRSAPEAAYARSAPEAAYARSAPEAVYARSAPEAAYARSAPEAAYAAPIPETARFAPRELLDGAAAPEDRLSRRARSNRAQAQARLSEQSAEYEDAIARPASPRSPRHAASPPEVQQQLAAQQPTVQQPAVQQPAAQQPAAQQPSTVRLTFDDGVTRVLTGTLVLGRNPVVDPSWPAAVPMPVADLQKSVSKTHVALTLMPGGVRVDDLMSTNGTVVVSPDGQPVPVQPNHPVLATDGASVVFGGRQVRVTVQ